MTVSNQTELQNTLEKALGLLEEAMGTKDLHHVIKQAIESLKVARLTNHQVFEELANLSNYIDNAKREIATIKAEFIGGSHIPTATDQLDEVVGATEEATNKIMDCCDAISMIAGTQSPEVNKQLVDQVTKIYEACNFQDLTGQRITKVVRTLKHIEGQVTTLLKALEDAGFRIPQEDIDVLNVSRATDSEKHLLNGPQNSNTAIKQDDIDKLFD